jgi:hypothetical protein
VRAFVVCLIGCGQALPPTVSTSFEAQTVPAATHAAFMTVPAELGSDDVVARIRHRVRVRWFRRASPIHGEVVEPVINRTQTADVDHVMPVIGESQTEIRVVSEYDDARLALWIDKRDAWPTLIAGIKLADREGRAPRGTGVTLETGAPIDVAFGRDRIRHVTLRDPDVAVDGWVPASVLGNVWLAPVGDRVDFNGAWSTPGYEPPSDARDKTMFVERAIVRAAPDASSPIVGIVLGNDVIGFVNARGAWSDVEIPRPHARIRGFVRTSELRKADGDGIGHGSGTGTGFGMSHSDRISVPAGACLYDKVNGEVVGVQIADSEHLGESDVEAKWSRVYIDSPWAVLGFFVHDTGSDSKLPVWESCTRR